MILSLLWKESREHLFKLLALTTLFAIFLIPFYFWNRLSFDVRDLTIGFFMPTCWLIPLWMAAATVTSEKSQRTARLLSAMPLHTPFIFLIKSIAALLTMLLPMSLLFLFLATHNNLLTPNHWLGMLVGIASLYLMTTALTATLERETAVAMWGLLLTVFAFLWILLIQYIPGDNLRHFLIAPDPFTPLMYATVNDHGQDPTTYQPHLIQLAMAAFWWTIALLRYNTSPKFRPTQSGADVPVGPTSVLLPTNKLPHSHSIFRTLLWREFREQAWIILAAALAGLLFASIIAILTARNSGYSPTSKLPDIAHMFAQCSLSLSIFIPAVVAIILGISSWASDLHSKLFDFWRSRPIPPATLFWSKFLTSLLGILALMTTFLLTSLAASAYASSHGLPFNQHTDLADFVDIYTTAPLALTAILAITISITLLIRRPLYAGITALTFVLLITAAATKLQPGMNLLHEIQLLLTIITAAALTLSHHALTHNWQLKPTTH